MDISLTERCRAYAERLHRISKPDDFFFQTRDGEYFARQSVYAAFRQLLWKCGISYAGRAYGPRVHDFRHTHAVHCLKRWVKNGYELSSALPVLSTYLGHTTFVYRLDPRCVPPAMRPSAECDAAGFIATQGTSIPQSVDSRQSWPPAKRASGYTFGCSANGRRALRSDGTAKYIPIQL